MNAIVVRANDSERILSGDGSVGCEAGWGLPRRNRRHDAKSHLMRMVVCLQRIGLTALDNIPRLFWADLIVSFRSVSHKRRPCIRIGWWDKAHTAGVDRILFGEHCILSDNDRSLFWRWRRRHSHTRKQAQHKLPRNLLWLYRSCCILPLSSAQAYTPPTTKHLRTTHTTISVSSNDLLLQNSKAAPHKIYPTSHLYHKSVVWLVSFLVEDKRC